MGYSLVINGPGAGSRSFLDLDGRCIFERHPGQVLMFANKSDAAELDRLGHCRVEYFREMTPAAMLAAAQKFHASEGIVSVATLDERFVEDAADLRTALGLPGLRVDGARYFRDKVLMKRKLQGAGIRVPRFVANLDQDTGDVLELLASSGRIVVKPRSGCGSKDVRFFDAAAPLLDFLRGCRDPAALEAEEFIDGVLYHSNSLVEGGRVVHTGIAEYLPGMANIDFGQGVPFVSLMENEGPLHDRLRDFSERVIAAFGLQDGVTHLEVFHSASDELVFCEMGIRPGGGGIVQMIEHQTGINFSLAALLAEEGGGLAAARRGAPGCAGRAGLVGIRNAAMGMAARAPINDGFGEPWIRDARILVDDGQLLTPAEHCTDFVALFIIEADDRAQFVTRVDQLQGRFDALVEVVPL